uniref:Glucosidase II beta subunit N-terminal domain-containing protein n=1 Tax=Ciona savignyi TaxID=51511 RepID=H2YQR6_CIOSA
MVCVMVISVLVLVHAAYAGDGLRIRGVSLTKNSLYNPDRDFTCFDGSKSFQFSLVNDDYCDCTDGSDEPGTSACPNGSFHCPNPGYRPANIPSSRVNDGVCDCCDGSDEWKNTQKCQNTCNELWIAEKQRLAEENEAANIGIKLKEEFSKTGLSKKAERQAKVAELETKLEELSAKEEDLKISKEEIESREATALEEHRRVKEEQRLKEAHEDNLKRGAEAFSEMDSDKDAILVPAELVLHSELDPDTSDSEFTAAEAEVMLQADSVDLNYFLTNVWPMINSTFQTTLAPPVEQQEQENQEVKTEEDLGEDDILRGEVVDEEDYYEDEEETDQEDHQEEEEAEEEGPSSGP